MKFFLALASFVSLLIGQDIKKELDAFRNIKIDVAAYTKVEFGDRYYIEVKGRKKNLKKLEIYVSGNTLRIKRKRKRNFFTFNSFSNHTLEIRIICKSLGSAEFNASGNAEIASIKSKKFALEINGSTDVEMAGEIELFDVSIDGSGNLDFDKLTGEDVNIDINGSGDVKISGTTNFIEISINGSGNVIAHKLKSKKASIQIMGSGDVKIAASDKLKVNIMGSGDVIYKGNPHIKKNIMGSGDVEKY